MTRVSSNRVTVRLAQRIELRFTLKRGGQPTCARIKTRNSIDESRQRASVVGATSASKFPSLLSHIMCKFVRAHPRGRAGTNTCPRPCARRPFTTPSFTICGHAGRSNVYDSLARVYAQSSFTASSMKRPVRLVTFIYRTRGKLI